MRHHTRAVGLLVCLLSSAVQSAPAPETETLQVMLQGGSSQELTQLVETQGGTITHDLHIINAVGALLTQAQLDKVLKSPLVTRHIDDLSVSEAPDEPDESTCEVGGALELDYDTRGLRWTLYNKLPAPAILETLELTWPATLGTVEKISLGDTTIDPELYRDTQIGTLKLQFSGPAAPVLTGKADLRVDLKSPSLLHTSDLPLRQRDFTITASFLGDCSTKLIPGYENNHENFYYASVAGADALHLQGITGKGVTVAVLDSGLWEHEALVNDTSGKPRVLARYDAIKNISGNEVFDESGHGTHMTSVIAHSGAVTVDGKPTGSFKGTAPNVNLVAVKAFDVEGQGDLLDIVRAVQWVVDNRETYDIRVLNLSFSARPRWHYWEDPINQTIMRAWASGIIVIAAAGNTGPDPMTIGSPGNLPYVITVGAMTDSWTPDNRDDDYIPDFSSRGPTPTAHIKPDIVAPGGHITGLTRPNSTLMLEHPDYMLSTGEFVMTGSSQASALVSGIAALLLELEPNLSPDDIKCKLLSSAEPAIHRDGFLAYSPFQQGHGQVNATRAVTLGQIGCGNSDMNIRLDISGVKHFQGPAIVESDGNASLPGLSKIVSPEPSERGLSKTRKWGVKAHIERLDPAVTDLESSEISPIDWQKIYRQEKTAMESLIHEPPE
ncbi:MAG: alkaline serine protease [Gammaproteobacteria bacterium]|nr:MAG: alkaline serine protease [Gammaproteobacteria bacterium]RLA60393.1 MAG: alkaline serine protease [Gammaproteobacteria bacterium]